MIGIVIFFNEFHHYPITADFASSIISWLSLGVLELLKASVTYVEAHTFLD